MIKKKRTNLKSKIDLKTRKFPNNSIFKKELIIEIKKNANNK